MAFDSGSISASAQLDLDAFRSQMRQLEGFLQQAGRQMEALPVAQPRIDTARLQQSADQARATLGQVATNLGAIPVGVPRLDVAPLKGAAADPDKSGEFRATEAAANVLGLQVQSLEIRGPGDVESVLELAIRTRADVFTALANPVTISRRRTIVDFANKNQQPAIYNDRAWVQDGSLMAYGANPYAVIGRAAYYVDRILKGTSPADLPVEQPMRFDFIVNMRTARELGITFPHEVALQITEVIE
jgi:putative ABC transport system substrate-binding protein